MLLPRLSPGWACLCACCLPWSRASISAQEPSTEAEASQVFSNPMKGKSLPHSESCHKSESSLCPMSLLATRGASDSVWAEGGTQGRQSLRDKAGRDQNGEEGSGSPHCSDSLRKERARGTQLAPFPRAQHTVLRGHLLAARGTCGLWGWSCLDSGLLQGHTHMHTNIHPTCPSMRVLTPRAMHTHICTCRHEPNHACTQT